MILSKSTVQSLQIVLFPAINFCQRVLDESSLKSFSVLAALLAVSRTSKADSLITNCELLSNGSDLLPIFQCLCQMLPLLSKISEEPVDLHHHEFSEALAALASLYSLPSLPGSFLPCLDAIFQTTYPHFLKVSKSLDTDI